MRRERTSSTSDRTGRATGGPRMHVGRPRSSRAHPSEFESSQLSTLRRRYFQQSRQCRSEFVERQFGSVWSRADQVDPWWNVEICQQRPKATAQSIAGYRRPQCATYREGHTRRLYVGVGDRGAPQWVDPNTNTFSPEADECVSLADPIDQAERRARPLARRDFRTARPARVLMRARKPCLRARRRLLGW